MSTGIEPTKGCAKCHERQPLAEFARDRSRPDGLTYWCRGCRNARQRKKYAPKGGRPRGRRYVAPRDGDRAQARRRVNHLVAMEVLPNPNDVACKDCGHIGAGPRHEYDHYLGYAAQHHEDVESVCAPCHHARELGRRVLA